jgi:hypothetical protein
VRQRQADPQTTTSAAASRDPSREAQSHSGKKKTNSNLTAKAISHQTLIAAEASKPRTKIYLELL